MVERYGGLAGGIVPADDGPWVRYSDYMVMEADRDFWKERFQVETRVRIEAEVQLAEARKALEEIAARPGKMICSSYREVRGVMHDMEDIAYASINRRAREAQGGENV